MSRQRRWGGDDHNVTLDAADDDWQWRRTIRSNPHSHLIYRIVVGVLGLVIVVIGLIMVPFPGPGWLVVFTGNQERRRGDRREIGFGQIRSAAS